MGTFELSRAADQWINELVSLGITAMIELTKADDYQLQFEPEGRSLFSAGGGCSVISHGSALIKGNKLGLRQKEFSQRLQFNIYFQLSCSPITGSAPPC